MPGDEVAVETAAPLAVGEYFEQLLTAGRDGSLPGGEPLAAAFASGGVRLLALKAAHRAACEATDGAREAAGGAKAQLDDSSLQLQNLLYERQHYEKEIGSCRGWRSAYTDEQIALVTAEEFARLAPDAAAEAGEDAHKLMLARLTHEGEYRREFVRQLEGVKARRDALAADVAQKRSLVAGLEGEVGKLLAAARAVQQQYAPGAGEGGASGGDAAEPAAGGGDAAMAEA